MINVCCVEPCFALQLHWFDVSILVVFACACVAACLFCLFACVRVVFFSFFALNKCSVMLKMCFVVQ